jgi:hypothetical protein
VRTLHAILPLPVNFPFLFLLSFFLSFSLISNDRFQDATAFSQTLCWDTSGVSTKIDMFKNSGEGSADRSGTGVCAPSAAPSLSKQPSEAPSAALSLSEQPSEAPSLSEQPSEAPSAAPSLSEQPSEAPSAAPALNEQPYAAPSEAPSTKPSGSPSDVPSDVPSASPSSSSASPSKSHTVLTDFQDACDAWFSDSDAATVEYGDIAGWDTSKVTDMSSMFQAATVFNQDLTLWKVGAVTTMVSIFNGASEFYQILCWDLTGVLPATDMLTNTAS